LYFSSTYEQLGLKSYSSSDSNERPLSFVLAAENKYFVDGMRRHKSKQYNLSSSSSKVHALHEETGSYSPK